VINAYPQIQHWAIGGHSLRGSMAAQFVSNHPGKVAGLVVWASYPAGSMVDNPVQVVSISGSQDGLATPAKIDVGHKLEPANTRFVVVAGGNHAQFGSYGLQPGDGTATISPAVQWEQTVKATLDLLNQIEQ
jgi:pimeloyl-ACP methyl ester carboxylesterase